MKSIKVALQERSYAIQVVESYRDLPRALKRLHLSGPAWIVTHRALFKRYGKELTRPLKRAGWAVETVCVPESERSKSFAMAESVITHMARKSRMRVPVVFAFGGGVVGDLAGFVAASYRRGVPWVQLPTTLLAQVDSSIGGKVGVDLPQGKNLVGAFYQPRLVVQNLRVLHSLPMRQVRSGLGEIIKYGVIADAVLFRYLEQHMPACLALRPAALREMVARSCAIKARVVAQDERETRGLRLHLNFGHTIGHAIEAAARFTTYTHGEAIAVGMAAASWLAVQTGLCSQNAFERIEALIRLAGLPVRAGNVRVADVFQALKQDKKFVSGKPRWVLPERIGRVVVSEQVPVALVKQALVLYLK